MFAELDQNFQGILTEALFLELYRYARISLFTRDYYILANIELEGRRVWCVSLDPEHRG